MGFVAGFFYYGILIYWIPSVPAHYGNMSLGLSLLIYLIFILFLGLFWAFFSLFFSKILIGFPKFIFLLAPFLWVSFEYILTHFLTGFPWGLLGYSQFKNILYIQMASLAGVYSLSFVIVLFQSLFVASMLFRKKFPFFLGLGLLIFIHLGGFFTLKKVPQTKRSFQASVVQGNVSSTIYWDEVSVEEILRLFSEHLDLSRQASLKGSKLIIWPEFTVPLCFSCPDAIYNNFKQELFQFVKETNCTLLLGTNETTGSAGNIRYHNTALCLQPDLTMTEYYKMHLVPFGEYTPYKKIFSFIEKMTHAIGDITAGTSSILHQFEGLPFGSPICYEIIFPNLVRTFVKKGATFLVTITNDGWYGKSSAPYQHFSAAVLRAVENRRYLLRAATTGISGVIDPCGRILTQSELQTKTFLTEKITPSEKLTFYTKYGDFFPVASLTLSAIFLMLAIIKRKNEGKNDRRQRRLS